LLPISMYEDTEYDSFMQIVKYNILNTTTSSINSVQISSFNRTLRWGVRTGTIPNITPKTMIMIPINMYYLHGSYWSNQFYDYVFFIVSFVIAILYLSSSFGYKRIISASAIYAIAAFSASFCAKIYHIILASFRINASELIFSILINGVVFELLPIAICILQLQFFVKKSYIQGLLSVVTGGALLLCGSSYYIGPSFIIIAGSLTILKEFFL